MTRSACAFDVPLDAAAWSAVAAGEAGFVLSPASTGGRPVLRLNYDFNEGVGFVVAHCPIHHELSEDYTVAFRLRGRGKTNNLEIKLVDASGQNVWRHVHENLQSPARWQSLLCWGPW